MGETVKIYKITNWDQLTIVKSTKYPNLKITTEHYNSEDLQGIKIIISDINNKDIYFTGFISLYQSNLFNINCCYTAEDMIHILNSYGFNIEFIPNVFIVQRVYTTLQGLYTLGYRYIGKKAVKEYKTETHSVLLSDYLVYVTKDMNYNEPEFIISNSPDFHAEDYRWVPSDTLYSISQLLGMGE